MKGYVGKSGKSFKNRVKYILKDEHDFICSNMISDKDNVSDLTDEFKAVSSFRPDVNKPTFHAFLSVPKGEHLTDQQWQQIAQDYLKEMNIDTEKHQYICVRHKDTDKDHIHIVANRVGLDGSVWHGQRSAFNTIAACERLEVKHGLTITKGLQGQKSELSAPTKNEIEQALRTGEKPARIVLQNALQAAMSDKPDLHTVVERLQAVGISPRFNVATTGNVSGVSFCVRDIAFKGSQLGKKFSWNNIKNRVIYDKNRDDELIRSLSAREANGANSDKRPGDQSSINDDRAASANDADTVGIDSAHPRANAEVSSRNVEHLRPGAQHYKISNRRAVRALQAVAKVYKSVKSRYSEKAKQTITKSLGSVSTNQYNNNHVGRILDYAEAAASASSKFRQQSSSDINSPTTKIEALRKRLGIEPKPDIKSMNKTKAKPMRIEEREDTKVNTGLIGKRIKTAKEVLKEEAQHLPEERKKLKI